MFSTQAELRIIQTKREERVWKQKKWIKWKGMARRATLRWKTARSGRSGECVCMCDCVWQEGEREEEQMHVCIDAWLRVCLLMRFIHVFVDTCINRQWIPREGKKRIREYSKSRLKTVKLHLRLSGESLLASLKVRKLFLWGGRD